MLVPRMVSGIFCKRRLLHSFALCNICHISKTQLDLLTEAVVRFLEIMVAQLQLQIDTLLDICQRQYLLEQRNRPSGRLMCSR